MRPSLKIFFCLTVVGMFSFVRPEMKTGGMISLDGYFFYQDSYRYPWQMQGARDSSAFFAPHKALVYNIPMMFNRVWSEYRSENKSVQAYFELRAGDQKPRYKGNETFWSITNNIFSLAYAWFKWKPDNLFSLSLGRQPQAFSLLSPHQVMGFGDFHGLGDHFGNIDGETGKDGVRADFSFSENLGLSLFLIDPATDRATNEEAPSGFEDPKFGKSVEQNIIPRMDVSFPVTLGDVRLEPSATWLRRSYSHRLIGSDDTYDIWGVALGAEINADPVYFSTEFNFGQNLGDGNYSGTGFKEQETENYAGADYYKIDTAIISGSDTLHEIFKILNTDVLSWWMDLGLKFGKITPHVIFGLFMVDTKGIPAVDTVRFLAGRKIANKTARLMAGISIPIKLTDRFTICPEVMYYDWSGGYLSRTLMKDYAGYLPLNTLRKENKGEEILAGIQTRWEFDALMHKDKDRTK